MSNPVGYQKGIELGGIAVVESYDKLATVRAQALQRMGQACREVPQIAFLHIRDLRPASFIQNRHTADSVSHDGPLRLLVPVEFTNAAWAEAHVDARDRLRDLEVGLGDL